MSFWNSPSKILIAIQALGFRTMARAVLYGWQKARLDRGQPSVHDAVDDWRGPGRFVSASQVERGLKAQFEAAELEVLVLAPDLLRVSWGPATEPVPYALERRISDWPLCSFQLVETGVGWRLETDALQLELTREDGSLRLFDQSGVLVRHERPLLRSGSKSLHSVALDPAERVFGLGQRCGAADHRGREVRFWNRDPGGEYGPEEDPVYLGIPAYFAIRGEAAVLVFYENSHEAIFDIGRRNPGQFSHRFEGGMVREYLVPAPPAQALARFFELTGAPAMPPLWALGYHQCRYSYYPDARVRQLCADFVRHDVPLDAIHLDIHHMDRFRSFTWDGARFPAPAALARDLAAEGTRLVVIVDPGIEKDHHSARYRDAIQQQVVCQLPGGAPVVAPLWPGWSVFPDFTDEAARAWWGQQYRGLVEAGIAGIWNDMNEPSAFSATGDTSLPRVTRHRFDGRGGDHGEAHNLYGLLLVRSTREGLERLAPDRRPFVLSRSGWAGLSRHAWHWTGDTKSDWPSLRQTVPMVLGLSLTGVVYSGPDIGGFSGTPTPELYARWLQLGVLLPFCRTHTIIGSPEQDPWSYGDSWLAINRDAIRLRYSLLPYLYTAAWSAHAHGVPLVRPLWWDLASDARLLDVDDAFLLGPSLLVAPVLDESVRERHVELPGGGWYDFWKPAVPLEREARLEAPIERIPLLVRAGTVLPRVAPASSTARLSKDRLKLHLYAPGAGAKGESTLYADAGDGPGYENGDFRVDRFSLHREGSRLTLHWSHEGRFAWPYRELELHVYGIGGVTRVTVDGTELAPREGRWVASAPFETAIFDAV